MNKKSGKKQAGAEGAFKAVRIFLHHILELLVSAYMLLAIVVMPFYFQEGYNHIGSDKSVFFRTVSFNMAKLLLPLLVVYGLLLACEWVAGSGRKDHRGKISVTDCFVLLYAFGVAISYVCSPYRETALWGEEGWYMGTLPQLFLVGIYFFVSRFWKKMWIFYLYLPVSAVVFFLGIINRFSWYPIPMENSGLPFFISTIGNINWYCGYLTAVLFAGAGLFWTCPRERKLERGLLALYMAIGFASLVTQGSDSGVFAVAVTFLVLFCISAKDLPEKGLSKKRLPEKALRVNGTEGWSSRIGGRMLGIWEMLLLFSVSCLVILAVRFILPDKMNYVTTLGNLLTYSALPIVLTAVTLAVLLFLYHRERQGGAAEKIFPVVADILRIAVPSAVLLFVGMIVWNTLHPGSLGGLSEKEVFTFGPTWGSNRGATWTAGIKCFLEQSLPHKLVGVGPDCMWEFINKDGSAGMLAMVTETFDPGNRLTNAHCEWLTVLVNTGIIGLLGFAGMMLSAVVRFVKRRNVEPVAAACGLCVLTYTANNLWSFQQSMNVAAMFVLLGIGEALCRRESACVQNACMQNACMQAGKIVE